VPGQGEQSDRQWRTEELGNTPAVEHEHG
jgi:hypothetical protein